MNETKNDVWERAWAGTGFDPLDRALERYYKMESEEITLFRQYGVQTVCDAACGYGAYSVAFASQGFRVDSFDISETAAALTRRGLTRFGLDASRVRTADVRNTGYRDAMFDGVVAHSVLDHMTVSDAQEALEELLRITRPGGLVLVSFDAAEEADLTEEHVRLEDGSICYTGPGKRGGMVLHPYTWDEIGELLRGQKRLYQAVNEKGEQVAVLQKQR